MSRLVTIADPQTSAATPLYVDGSFGPASGEPIDVIDPATEETLASIASADEREVEAALRAARTAQRSWARTSPIERGRHLRAIADLLLRHRDRFERLLVAEVGKPLRQARAEVDFAEGLMRYAAEWDRRLEGEILPGEGAGEQIHLIRAPVGVVAAICPWNFPLAVLCRKLGPALLTGNTVVIKPSEVSPLGTLELIRLIDEELDIPPGVIGLVT